MVNYIISYTTGFFINNKFVDMLTRTSRVCSPNPSLTLTDVQIGGVKCQDSARHRHRHCDGLCRAVHL